MCCSTRSVFSSVYKLRAQLFVFPPGLSFDYFVLLFVLLTVEAFWDSYKYCVALACISPAFGSSIPGRLLDSINYLSLFSHLLVLSRGVFQHPYRPVVTEDGSNYLHILVWEY